MGIMGAYEAKQEALAEYIAELTEDYRALRPAGCAVLRRDSEHGGGSVALSVNGRFFCSFPGGDGNHFGMEIAELNAYRRAVHVVSGRDFHAWGLYHVQQLLARQNR